MEWRHRIVADPDVLVGKPVIKGTRISVDLMIAGIQASAVCIDFTRPTP